MRRNFVLRSYKAADEKRKAVIKKMYPEAFKKSIKKAKKKVTRKFKNGDWIKLKEDPKGKIRLICIENLEKSTAYGHGQYVWKTKEQDCCWTFKRKPENWRLASEKEVKDMLLTEAKKRKFRKGCTFQSLDHDYIWTVTGKTEIYFLNNKVYLSAEKWETIEDGYKAEKGHLEIFRDGKWASIIK